ncbi:MAG: hypothetical protein AB8B70_01465 [Prochlorococcus sp.]
MRPVGECDVADSIEYGGVHCGLPLALLCLRGECAQALAGLEEQNAAAAC